MEENNGTAINVVQDSEMDSVAPARHGGFGGDLFAVERGQVNGGSDQTDVVDMGGVPAFPVTESEYSPKAKKSRPARTPKPLTAREIASEKVVDMTAFKAAGDYSPSVVFDADKWKRSRVKKGWLIERIKGYDPVEGEYGVHYLKVLKRNPKKTSGDCSLHEHAGFATWEAMQSTGRLVKERKRYGRLNEDRATAS